MCGIYGTTSPVTIKEVEQRLKAIQFRGPDFSNHIEVDGITLGHNRLSIIDLDPRSHQPFTYQQLTIVYNGEIFNYQQLKDDLKSRGHQFRTNSDTEVLAASYHAYGVDCLEKLNGQFSFVIYDQHEKKLFGARDRFGQKPFYYSLQDGFEFASQLLPLTIGRSYTIGEESVSQYFIYKYIPEPATIYREVRKLRAGHYFTYDLTNRHFETHRYYTLADESAYVKHSIEDTCNKLDRVLKSAVGKRLIADVPLGVFLSGGIDSSLIAAYAAQEAGKRLKTFSMRFNESEFDESPYAEKVAKALGTDHHTITCDYESGLSLIEDLSKYYQEPFADSSQIPTMLLSRETRRHVTVALSGDGGDESFIGYQRYEWMRKVQSIYRVPLAGRKLIAKILSLTNHRKLGLIAAGIELEDLGHLYHALLGGLSDSTLRNSKIGYSNEYTRYLHTDKPWIDRYSDFDIKTYLNGDINTKVDRAGMAFSLEIRSPFLDHEVVEAAKSIPIDQRYPPGALKDVLKRLLARRIPRELFDRPKQGFTMPFRDWFRGELREYVQDLTTTSNLKMIPNLNVKGVRAKIDAHLQSKANHYPLIWAVIVYIQWYKDNHCGR